MKTYTVVGFYKETFPIPLQSFTLLEEAKKHRLEALKEFERVEIFCDGKRVPLKEKGGVKSE